MKNIFRRASSSVKERPSAPSASETTSGGTNIAGERLTDQTERGEMLPSAGGNAEGATNLNSNAEMGWPGMINNEKLAAILIPLSSIGKKVGLGGGKKAEGSWVSVQVCHLFVFQWLDAKLFSRSRPALKPWSPSGLTSSNPLPSQVSSSLNLTKTGSEPRGEFTTEAIQVYPQLMTLFF